MGRRGAGAVIELCPPPIAGGMGETNESRGRRVHGRSDTGDLTHDQIRRMPREGVIVGGWRASSFFFRSLEVPTDPIIAWTTGWCGRRQQSFLF